MTLKNIFSLAVLSLAVATAPGCPEDAQVIPNYDALPDIGAPDSSKETGGGDDGAGGAETDVPLIDIALDVPSTPGTVKALQNKAEAAGCDEAQIQNVADGETLTGVVVTSPKFDAFTPTNPGGVALDGYFVADADGGAWSGIQISIPRDDASDYKPGDVLDLTGNLLEFYCQTQLTVTTHTKTSDGATVTPQEVSPQQVATEPFEGMLLTVKDVQITETLGGGTYRMTGGFVVDHAFDFFLTLDEGKTYTLTGQIMYNFQEYRLVPRTQADIVVTGGPSNETSISAIQTDALSLACENGFVNGPEDLTIEGVVSVGKYYVTGSLDGYIVSDETGGPNSGIQVTVPTSSATDWAVGTKVKVVGDHKEFYCLTQFAASSFEVLGTDGVVPAPTAVSLADLAASPEQYEGVTVTVTDATVQGVSEFNDGDLNGTGVFIDNAIMGNAFPDLVDGTTYSSLTGVVFYSFDHYRIAPRDEADMVVGGPVEPPVEMSEMVEPMPDAVVDTVDDATAETVEDVGPDADPETTDDAVDNDAVDNDAVDTDAVDNDAVDTDAVDNDAVDTDAVDDGTAD